MSLWPKRIDHRGRRIVGQRRPTRADALASGAGRAQVDAHIGHPNRHAAMYGALMGLSFAGLPALAMALLAALPAALAWPLIVGIVVGIVALAATLVRAARRSFHPPAWLTIGLCPGCAYRLAGIEPEDDGCRICPECGSAWRMDGQTADLDACAGGPRMDGPGAGG